MLHATNKAPRHEVQTSQLHMYMTMTSKTPRHEVQKEGRRQCREGDRNAEVEEMTKAGGWTDEEKPRRRANREGLGGQGK